MTGDDWVAFALAGALVLGSVALFLAAAIGWVWNIVKLATMVDPGVGMIIVRSLGIIFAPLGCIVGYF